MTIERIKSYITGLDELIQGGFPKQRTMLVSGSAGSGKTIFGMQYIYHGAKNGEPGVFITVDERPELIRQDMANFGWDVEEMEEEGMMAILDASATKVGFPSDEKYSLPQVGLDVDELILKAMKLVDKLNAKRLVLDSIPGIGMQAGEQEMRSVILRMNYMFAKEKVTAIMTSEIPEQGFGKGPTSFSKYGVEEYVADGVITLHYLGAGSGSNRSMFIRKMRGTAHVEEVLPMEITDEGIIVKQPEKGYNY